MYQFKTSERHAATLAIPLITYNDHAADVLERVPNVIRTQYNGAWIWGICTNVHVIHGVQLQAKRVVRETQVAAALDVRADTRAAKKVRWDDKLPTVDKLARTGANKAQQASKTANAQNTENNKGGRAWNGAKGGSVVKVQQTEGSKAYAEQDKVKAKPKLRIQRGR
ncbi:MAG: hypothetical protein ASARMPRED_006073 [Alectoria sarmentosa]|nr:MAG: hypothetical protein ASARMPRED_006073 [Alectoria sarmentosa]